MIAGTAVTNQVVGLYVGFNVASSTWDNTAASIGSTVGSIDGSLMVGLGVGAAVGLVDVMSLCIYLSAVHSGHDSELQPSDSSKFDKYWLPVTLSSIL